MWRVRRKNERGFNDGFHLQNGEGARQLVELLNKQDSELTAARAEIEEYKNAFTEMNQALGVEVEEVERLKLELTAVTKQRDRLAEALRQMWPFIEEDDYPNCNTPAFNAAILKYKEALQSLTTNTPDQERKSPASDGSGITL
jgi:chromosome segregation ATPase